MTHVLVVDDSEVDRQLAGKLLERHGRFHVEFASNGLEALEHLDERIPLAIVKPGLKVTLVEKGSVCARGSG